MKYIIILALLLALLPGKSKPKKSKWRELIEDILLAVILVPVLQNMMTGAV